MLINGQERERLPASDRGLHFGDGVFETMAVEQGRALCLERHLRRLAVGCERLAIAAPPPRTLEEECARVARGAPRAVLKLTVTRGSGGRGYAPQTGAAATRVVARHPWPAYPAEFRRAGVAVRICRMRLGRNPRLAGIKHLNRLEQVLARMEEDAGHCQEGLMLDDGDRVIEGIMSNLFISRHGRICTPDLSECGVAGIMREQVLETAAQLTGADPQVAAVSLDTLWDAEECFLTNSLIGVWPIRSIEGRAMSSGPLAGEFQRLLMERGAITRD